MALGKGSDSVTRFSVQKEAYILVPYFYLSSLNFNFVIFAITIKSEIKGADFKLVSAETTIVALIF